MRLSITTPLLRLALLLCFGLNGVGTRAQAPAWQTGLAAPAGSGSQTVNASTVDGSGSVYLAGNFSGTLTFGSTTLSSAGAADGYVAKWNPGTNSFAWAVRMGGSASDQVGAVAVSGTSIYVAGYFTGAGASFGSLALSSAGSTDAFVGRLTDAGTAANFDWVQRAGGTGAEEAHGLAVNGSNVYVAGEFAATATFGALGLTSAGGRDLFVAKLSDGGTAGTWAWANRAGGTGNESAAGLVAQGSALFVTGILRSNGASFGLLTASVSGSSDGYVTKLTDDGSSGRFNWVQRLGAQNADVATAVAVSGSSVYVAGIYERVFNFNPYYLTSSTGSSDIFIVKLFDNGSTTSNAWALSAGGPGFDYDPSLALSGARLYLAGTLVNTGNVFGGTTLSAAGLGDAYLARITDAGPSGAFDWALRGGTAVSEIGTSVAARGTAVYVSGHLLASTSFGAVPLTAPSGGLFVAGVADAPPAPVPVLSGVSPAAGPLGSLLTLTGTGLGGATLVTFAGSSANVTPAGFSVNAAGTELSNVEVPAGATTGLVTVTTPGGVSNGIRFTVSGAAPVAPAWQAVLQAGAQPATGYSSVEAAVADGNGNVYVAGTFSGSINFGPTRLTNPGASALFVAKYSQALGRYEWALGAAPGGSSQASALAVSGGALYVAGRFGSPALTLGNTTLTNLSTLGRDDAFLAKVSLGGAAPAFEWAQSAGGPADDYATGVAASGGSVYVAGTFNSRPLQFPGTALSVANTINLPQGFVAKFADNGAGAAPVWAYGAGDRGAATVTALAAANGALYLAGSFNGYPSSFGPIALTSAGYEDVFVAKLTDAGATASWTWAKRAGGEVNEAANALAVRGNKVYIAGYFASLLARFDNLTLAPAGLEDLFVAQLTDDGPSASFGWARRGGGVDRDQATALTTVGNQILVGGYLTSPTARLGTAYVSDYVLNQGQVSFHSFVAKLTEAGPATAFDWVQQASGMDLSFARCVAESGGSVLLGGRAASTVHFGPNLRVQSGINTYVGYLGILRDPALPTAALAAAAPALALYPNPARTTARVLLPAPAGPAAALTVLDALGRPVRRQALPAGATATEINLAGLAPGLYLVRVQAGGPQLRQRLVVE